MNTLGHWHTAAGKQASITAGRINLMRSSALGAAMRWRGRLPIPDNVHPLVRKFFSILNRERILLKEAASRAGILYATISDWRYRRNPTVPNFEAALNAVGYELRIVRRGVKNVV